MSRSIWFNKDLGRAIYEYEQEFLTKVIEILEEECPAQVDAKDTCFTGEGPSVLILIIPHKCLDGISLVIWYEESHVSLRWCHIGNLSYHDAIDLGKVTHYIGTYTGWLSEFSECLRGEFNRTIIVRYSYSSKITNPYRIRYYTRLYGERGLGKTYREFNPLHYFKVIKTEDIETSLKSTVNLPLCIKPNIRYGRF